MIPSGWSPARSATPPGGRRSEDCPERAATFAAHNHTRDEEAEDGAPQPTRFGLVRNLKAAKTLELAFAQSVLLRATEAIQ